MSFDLASDPLVWRTQRFVMRPLHAADAPELLALFGDPDVVEFMDIDPLETVDDALEIVDWASERRASGLGVRWAIRPVGEGALVGTCGFNTLERDRGRRGEVAYDLARAHWRRGVMSEILPELLDFGFQGLRLRRLEAFVTLGNEASCRLLLRHGFALEGTLRDHGFWKGRFWDQLVFGRLSTPQD